MKKAVIGLLILSLIATAFSTQKQEQNKLLRHVVLFSFKTTSTTDDIKKIEDSFKALPGKIKEIRDFEWGTNNSPENLAQGFTHCFFVSFVSEKDREIYLPHPDHKAFVAIAGPHIDKVLVLDYWAKK
jgi:hypothetical protein